MTAGGGPRGSTKASVSTVFTQRLRELQQNADDMQKAFQGEGQRTWQVPTELETSLLDIAKLHDPAFDREEINNEYQNATNDPTNAGTTGDVIALKLQIDYNAMEERAFRHRHMSLCRAMCAGHGRRRGQGRGILWTAGKGVEREFTSIIAAGGA